LAKELNKPLMIHCRQAHKEVIEILKKSKHYGNIHFFSGNWEQAKKYFDLGFTISFTGVITFARDYDEVIKKSPLDKIMIETDAPFARPLTPERSDGGRVAPIPYRGKRNEPFYVQEVAKKIAEIKNLSFEEVARTTTKTASTLFSLSPKVL
jgi:TatD DNase family protein